MKDALYDLVKVLSTLPVFEIVKVTGDKKSTKIQTRSADTTTLLFATTKKPIAEFEGVFGVNNIPMLNGLLNLPAFKEKKAKIDVVRSEKEGISIPTEITFANSGVAKASHRLVSERQVPKQMSAAGEIDWDVIIKKPSTQRISEFSQLSSIYSSQETKFGVKTEKGELKFLIGNEDSATHKATLTFAEEVTGTVKPGHMWTIAPVLSVLKLSQGADITLKISNQGVLQIDVSTEYADYEFVFAAFR